MNSSRRTAVVAVSVGVLTAALGAGLASADPSGSPTYRPLAGVGSDTTQDVMNAMANAITIGGNKVIGSYNATGSAQITTKDPTATPGCTLNRPNGSGAGKTALLASLNANSGAGDGCLQFSRSSSSFSGPNSPSVTFIPFAVDAVTYAVTNTSSISRSLSLADLHAYYTCDPNYVGTGPNYTVTPMLPQAGSGTRSFWEGKVGILDADVNANHYPCIINGTKNGQAIEEHTGTALDDKSIVPFSIAQYNAQSNLVISDKRGRAVLGTIDGIYPSLMNTASELKREVWNVIPTSKVGVSPWSDVFVGSNSLVCQQKSVITKYGFGVIDTAVDPSLLACGDTSSAG